MFYTVRIFLFCLPLYLTYISHRQISLAFFVQSVTDGTCHATKNVFYVNLDRCNQTYVRGISDVQSLRGRGEKRRGLLAVLHSVPVLHDALSVHCVRSDLNCEPSQAKPCGGEHAV